MIGSQIGNFRILEKLGEGGMGVVYKGIDIQLERPVAIKMLGSDLAGNQELVQRFQAEARAQANLNHTNIATLYAFLIDQGRAFMVMELVEGETFDQIIRRGGPMNPALAVPLFKQALMGIGAAHRMGIIHRDIKPSNLMLNRQSIVKVMDFGIAKALGTRGMTRTGMQMGTLSYMSPEQIQNRGVDARSDIYALGITLYEMLTGHVPFESDSDFQVMHDHVNTPPPPLVRYYAYAPREFEGVIAKALAKGPDLRFQTVEEFGAALEHPESVSAPVPPPVPVHPPMGQTIIDTSGGARYSGAGTAGPPPPPYSARPVGPVAATATPPPLAPTYQSPAYGTVVDPSAGYAAGAAAAPAPSQAGPPMPPGGMPPTVMVGPGSTPPPMAPGPIPASAGQPKVSPKLIAAISGAAILLVIAAAIFWPRSSNSGGGGGGSTSGGGGGGGGTAQATPLRNDNEQVIDRGGTGNNPGGNNTKIGEEQATPEQAQGRQGKVGVGDQSKGAADHTKIAKNEPPPRHQETPVPSTPAPTPPPTPNPTPVQATPYPTPYPTPNPTPYPTPRAQPAAATFIVKHRHVVTYGFQTQTYFCGGVIVVRPDGTVGYECQGTADPSRRCERVVFPPGTIKKLTMKGGELHLSTTTMGNWDFFDLNVAGATANAYQAILPYVR